ncbi:uncharacterized protein [Nicotiana sylvestris]|uniref:uncharacterized protein n=1 Tax=Nicotiana sylvestris TaxID=4096 RepID=UPI00388C7959
MTRYSIKELVNYDSEIERSLRLRRKGQALSSQSIACEGMENQEVENINPREVSPPVQIEDQFDEVTQRPANRILRDYARPDRFNWESSVRKPPVVANNFEIRTGLIQTIQQSFIFTGDASEDPWSHLIDFLEIVETAKYNGVPPEAIKLRLFPFALKRDAKTWLRSLPQGSITTWDQITQEFLNKYFFPAKTTKLRQDISNFLQTDTESVYQAWERLNAMLRKCPHHNVINAAAGGSVMGKTTEEALQLLNEISENAIQWPSERIIIKKAATVNQVDALNTLTQQIVSLAQKFETFQVNTQQPSQSEACDMCGGNHQNHECQATNHNDEHVNVIGYNAILQNKLPQKFGDPGSFTIPCTLGGVYFEKALCDSGASINLMPFSIFKKLDLGEIKDTSVSLQFADQSTKKPKRIIENVLVRVDKFVFPVDFMYLK